ncbi:GntR family transcriptional regulator [Paenibacillus sp. FSL R5-0345]|uniref:MocR-like pyridoxine biosynthesis transcription factor PdxR n=1 Tax=Paenibacillus sp. FSL R5-0345 TaxID=1536770 RepID=UPI0004F8472D|nr:PLP-dependent aminotransferase family protein [Paenibacillus sp. FSL R5-0345]AIQ37678.1 GntR family transcriptional regulator [Paenibacillus sp. FSL R5-0345]
MNITLAYDQYLAIYRYKYLALYHALRAAILEGTLPGSTQLPSTRSLAMHYDMSRGSVSQVYDMLLADGYVRTVTGRGTFVSEDSFSSASGNNKGENKASESAAGVSGLTETTIPLSAWGRRLLARPTPLYEQSSKHVVSFLSSGMRMEHFPYSEWRSALSYAGGKEGGLLQSTCPPQGDAGLRKAIAAHLRITRGIRADAEHIVLFSGSMQGIVILTQLLLDAGGSAVVEDPGFHGIRRAVEITGGQLLSGKLDGSGLIPEDWDARLLFVTPSRQFPTGVVLPLERRRTLLEWAQQHDALIIEDDYDSEFRWSGRPIEPLKALDRGERVVYIGSFSNTMFSGLRLGFAVLPPSLVKPTIAAKGLYEPSPVGLLEQRALARFMNTGGYGRHLRRKTRIYGERGRILRALLTEKLKELFELLPGDAGLQVYARWLRSREEFVAFRLAARRRGTDFRDAALYQVSLGEPAACFAFAHLSAVELEEGVKRLLLAWEDVQSAT